MRELIERLTSGSFSGIVFHGTDAPAFHEFDIKKAGTTTDVGVLGKGIYFSTDENISRNKQTHIKARVRLRKPLRVVVASWPTPRAKSELVSNALGLERTLEGAALTRAVKTAGFDGVMLDYSPVGYKHQEVVVFDPKAVKVLETGTR